MNDQRMQFAIGLVTLMAGFALAALIVWFGDFQIVFQARHRYYVTVARAPGAAVKVPVRRAGIPIGEIAAVEYSDEFNVVVLTLEVAGNSKLRYGDEPVLRNSLLGETYLDIEVNTVPLSGVVRQEIPPGSVLEGKSPFEPSDAMERVLRLAPQAEKTLLSIAELSDSLKNMSQKIDALALQDNSDMRRAFRGVADASARLDQMLATTDLAGALADMRAATKSLDPTLGQFRTTAETLDRALQPFAGRSDQLSAELEATLTELRSLLRLAREGDGTVARLLRDGELYNRVNDAAAWLVANLVQLERVLRDVRVFADKIARHPGELGVQGVFSRDTGVKLPPTAPAPPSAYRPTQGTMR